MEDKVRVISKVMKMKEKFSVKNMHCTSCERTIKNAVMEMKGVNGISVSYISETADVEFDPLKTDSNAIIETINELGYDASLKTGGKEIKSGGKKGFFSRIFGGKK